MRRATALILLILPLGCRQLPWGDNKKAVESPKAASGNSESVGFLCPQTAAEWQAWRDREMQTLLRNGYQTNARHMAEVFDLCKLNLESQPKASACMQNLKAFTRPRLLQKTPGHTLGLEMTDQEYLDSIPDKAYFDLPDFLKSQDFLQALDQETSGIEKAITIIDDFNRKAPSEDHIYYLIFQSTALLSPDDTSAKNRLLLMIPHSEYDQFVQYSLRDNISRPLGQSTSIIVAQKLDAKTKQRLSTPFAYFNDLYRVRNAAEVSYSTRLKENKGTLEDCTLCHKTAVLPIHPDAASFNAERFGAALLAINTRIEQHAGAVAVHFKSESDGPILASGPKDRLTDEFLRACAGPKIKEPKSLQRIRDAMACADCHNGKSRGALTLSSISRNQLPLGGNLIERYVVDLKLMPPNSDLSGDERKALVACLAADYSAAPNGTTGLIEQWLLQPGCQFQ